MLTVIIVVIGLSILILAHEAGHFFVAKWFKLKVDEFGFGFPPRIFAWKPKRKDKETRERVQGETEYSFNWLPFGGFVRIAGENDRFENLDASSPLAVEEKKRMFLFQSPWKKSFIIIAGVVVNFLMGWFLLWGVFATGAPQALVITAIERGSPAAEAKLERGDIIKEYPTIDAFITFVDAYRGEEAAFRIIRNGEERQVRLVPRRETQPHQGAIGVELQEAGFAPQSFFAAFGASFVESLRIGGLTVVGFWKLLQGLFTRGILVEDIVGPVGIFSIAYDVGQAGVIHLFFLLALISVNLAVINLIPFPALDGGRLLLIGIEKLKGSPLSRKTEIVINAAGFVFLIVLMIAVSVRDIANLS